MKSTFGIIADDLTGAMDAGVQLLKNGMRVRICTDIQQMGNMMDETDVIVVDTESRNIHSQQAYIRAKTAIRTLRENGLELVYKKVDSTLRGNIGSELDAVNDAYPDKLVIFAPALPYHGRITQDGYHYVNGVKLSETEMASDPFAPISDSWIPGIIHAQSGADVGILALKTIRNGQRAIYNEILMAIRNKCKVLIADAVEETDLKMLAGSISCFGNAVLPCGSAGLLAYIDLSPLSSNKISDKIEEALALNDTNTQGLSLPVVIISGSPAQMSKTQIQYAVEHTSNTKSVKISSELFCSEKSRNYEIRRMEEECFSILNAGGNLIIDGSGLGKRELMESYKEHPELLREQSNIILMTLSVLAQTILSKTRIAGLVLAGGDTAFEICRKLGAHGIELKGEVEPYIPHGLLIGGAYNQTRTVTKAGGFGKASTLANIIRYMRYGES